MTSAVAQTSPKSSTNTGITYTADYLSWGDVYTFGADQFTESNYALQNGTQSKTIYTSKGANDKKTGSISFYKYYGQVTTGNHGNVSNGTIMATHSSAEFVTDNLTQDKVEAPIANGQKIPVMSTSGTGRYSVVPNSTGTYRIFAFSAENPANVVKYALLDSYSAANDYGGTPSGSLSFTQITGTDWWYADVNVSYLGWTAYSLTVAQSTSTSSSAKDDTNGNTPFAGEQLTNSTLNDDYYYNVWTAEEKKYDTVLVLQFTSAVQLGPITKTGDTFTYAQATGGTISVQDIFGQTVTSGSSQPHMPLYITAEASSDTYAFTGLEGMSDTGSVAVVSDDLFKFTYEQTESVTAKWETKRALPAVTVSGADSRTLDFYLNSSTNVSMVAGSTKAYRFDLSFSGAESGSTVDYSVAYSDGDGSASGSFSADGGFDVSLAWGTATVNLTAKIGGTEIKAITYTVTADESGFPYVCKIGSTQYRFVEDALSAAASGNTIIMTANYDMQTTPKVAWGAVGSGAGYVVKSGVKLLLPVSASNTTIQTSSNYPNANLERTTSTGGTNLNANNTSVYLTLGIPAGITVVNNGTIAVGGTMTGNGAPTGAHSNLRLDGVIDMGNSSIMSAVGFVTGSGTVNAAGSGAKLYQCFTVLDFGGGGFTVSAAGVSQGYGCGTYPSGENGVIPFIRYATANYQCTVKLQQGNYMYGYCDLYAASAHHYTVACLVGDSSTTGLVTLSDGATLTGTYDASVTSSANTNLGKMTLTVSGGGNLGKLIMNVGVEVDLSKFAFPIPYNYDIVMENGDYNFIYDMQILPGATFTLKEDATLTISNNARLSVHDGMHEFRAGGNSATSYSVAWSTTYGRYPAASTLGTVSHGTYTGNMIIDGTLTIESGSTLAGVVQTHGSGTVDMKGSTEGVSNQIGLVGKASTNNGSYYWAGATVYTHQPEIFDTLTGQRIPMQQGLIYHGSSGASILEDFTYDLYTTSGNTSVYESPIETINANTEGSWWNYKGSVVVVRPETGDVLSSTDAYVAAGADLSEYYSDIGCSNKATNVSENNFVLYSSADNIVARVEWAAGERSYYMSLKDAVAAAKNSGDTVVLMKDIQQTEALGIGSTQDLTIKLVDSDTDTAHTITAKSEFLKNSGTVTLDLGGGTVATDAETALANLQTAFISNTGVMTIDLNGGLLNFASGVTAASSTYRATAAVVNDGTLTVTDSSAEGNGRLTTDLLEDSSTVTNYAAAIWNKPAATLSITGGMIETTQTVNAYSAAVFNNNASVSVIENATLSAAKGFGLYNYNGGTISTIDGATVQVTNASGNNAVINSTNAQIGAIQSSTFSTLNTVALNNTGNSHIGTISGTTLTITAPTTKEIYALENTGSTIETIDDCTITANSGIRNSNTRANSYTNQTTGATILYYGRIGKITDTTVTVGRYAIFNRATIDEISGHCVFTAQPASAQVNQSSGTAALNGNVQCYTIYNSNVWWADASVWKQTDDGLIRTQQWKTDEAYLPTIGKITDTVEIHARNTSTNANYGIALYNLGVIDEISGSVIIETSAHPNNAKLTTSNYALQNAGGGIIKSISGATITASNRALQNGGQFTNKYILTYSGKSADAPTTIGGQTMEQKYFYGNPSKIGSISNSTISATTQYSIYNEATIGDVTDCVISGNYNVVYNATAVNSYYHHKKVFSEGADIYTANTEYQRVYDYTRNTDLGSHIGTISGGSITATGAGYQAVYNMGYIEALKDLEISTPSGKATSGSTYYPLVFNSDSRQTSLHEVRTTEYNGTDAYVTLYEFQYNYGGATAPATINVIDGVAMTTPQEYAIRNQGYINVVENSSISAKLNAVVNEAGPYEMRKSYRYYSGTTPFATTKNVSEVSYDYIRVQPYIGLIENNTIETTGTTYAIRNAGHISTITNNNITSKTTGAIVQIAGITGEFHSNVNKLRSVTAVAATSLTNNYDTTENAKVESYSYIAPVIDCIGEGNTITGTHYAIQNKGGITSIDSGFGTLTRIKTTDSSPCVYNYTGIVGTKVRTATLKADNTNASYSDADTDYITAEIGTIKNTHIESVGIAIQNGDASATYPDVTIAELGEGVEATSTGSYAVYNQTYASIGTVAEDETKTGGITGGIYTASASGKYAVYNEDTSAPIYISGGDFKGGTNTDTTLGRAYAIYEPNNTARQTYPEGLSLTASGTTRSVTLADGTTVRGYYYIGLANPGTETVTGETTTDRGDRVGYATLAEAIAAYEAMSDEVRQKTYITLVNTTTETGNIKASKDLYLDLNGCTVNLNGYSLDMNGNTLYGMDARTNGYLSENETPGKIVGAIKGTVSVVYNNTGIGANAKKSYVTVISTDENKPVTEFHRFAITPIACRFYLDTNNNHAHLEVKAAVQGDTTVIGEVKDLGFTITYNNNTAEDTSDDTSVTAWIGMKNIPENFKDTYDDETQKEMGLETNIRTVSFIAATYDGTAEADYRVSHTITAIAAFDTSSTTPPTHNEKIQSDGKHSISLYEILSQYVQNNAAATEPDIVQNVARINAFLGNLK